MRKRNLSIREVKMHVISDVTRNFTSNLKSIGILLSHASIAQSCIICLYDKLWPAIYFGRLVPSREISEIKSPAKIS